MLNNKFLTLLKTLTSIELSQFEQYLTTRHAKKKIAISVFKYIKKFHSRYDHEDLDKKIAFKKIFKGRPFNYRKIMDAVSDLYLILEDFLVLLELKAEPFERNYLLMQNLKKRNANKFFTRKLEELNGYLNDQEKIDFWLFLNRLKLNHSNYYKTNTEKLTVDKPSIKTAMENLDLFFISAKFKYACELMSRKNLLQEELTINLLEDSIDVYQKKKLKGTPLTALFRLAILLISNEDIQHYNALKNDLDINKELLQKQDLHILNSYLLNFVTQKINQGKKQFISEAFDLFNFAIDNDILATNGLISSIRFYNIIDTACYLKKSGELDNLDWPNEFIENWKNYIEEDKRNNVVRLGRAKILFEDQSFSKVIEAIADVTFENVIFDIRARTLTIRSFYELKENKELISAQINAFDIFLKRNKTLNEKVKESSFNFVRLFRKLIKETPDKTKLKTLATDSQFLICRDWFLEQINLIP